MISDFSLFIESVREGNIEEVKSQFKLEYKELANDDSLKIIHIATECGHLEIVKWLCLMKCNLEACTKTGMQPIHYACKNGHFEIVKFLLENNCKMELCDDRGWRPIHYACSNGHVKIIKLLHDNKCDMVSFSGNGYLPIHHACWNGHVEVVKFFYEHNYDINSLTKDNKSPVDIVRELGHSQLVDLYEGYANLINIKNIKDAVRQHYNLEIDMDYFITTMQSKQSNDRESIGKGTFGKVFKIQNPNNNLELAIKTVTFIVGDIKTKIKSLEQNIDKYRVQLKHKRIMQYFGSIVKSERTFIFMEYLPKESLSKTIREKGPLNEKMIFKYSSQIIEGLAFLHGNKIIHRDIKPQNILLDNNDDLKLCDFGLSREFGQISKRNQKYTLLDNALSKMTSCGTPNYMAPEVIVEEEYDFSADIWSFGATVVEMLTGKVPYGDLNPATVVYKIGQLKTIEFESNEQMSPSMKMLIDKTLNSDPKLRDTSDSLMQFLLFIDW